MNKMRWLVSAACIAALLGCQTTSGPLHGGNAPDPAAAQAGSDAGHVGLIDSIGPVVVNATGEELPANTLASQEYVLLYYSASWCGPCRAFTPKLASFHRNNKQKGSFQVVLVSSDRSGQDMFSYMIKTHMPWVAVPYDRIKPSQLKQQYGGRGIPHLVLLDRDGQVLSSSFEGHRYVGPAKVMADLEARLKSDGLRF